MTSPYLLREKRSVATVCADLLERAATWHALRRPDLARELARRATLLVKGCLT